LVGAREMTAFGQRIGEFELADSSGSMTLLILDRPNNFESLAPYRNTKYWMGKLSTDQNCLAWQAKGKSFVLLGMRDHSDLYRSANVNSFPVAE
jgi:hypothetical protein